MEKRFTIQKIPLDMIIQAVHDLFNDGVEFVDMECTVLPDKDKIEFIPSEEEIYFSPVSSDNCENFIYLGP